MENPDEMIYGQHDGSTKSKLDYSSGNGILELNKNLQVLFYLVNLIIKNRLSFHSISLTLKL